jgi:hypothetical protein
LGSTNSLGKVLANLILLGFLLSCQAQQTPQVSEEAPKNLSVLTAEIEKVRLNMSVNQVRDLLGKPTSTTPVRDSDMETWDYEDITVLFEGGRVVQVIGESLLIGSESLPADLSLKEVSKRLKISESLLPRSMSSPISRSIPLQDGTLTISQSKGRVLNYGLQSLKKQP